MSLPRKTYYIISMVISLLGVFLLLAEDFGAWQDRDPFYGVTEGFVWIGSQKAFPFAQIGLTTLILCLLYVAYVSYKGYSSGEQLETSLRSNVSKAILAEIGLTIVTALGFIVLVMDSDWWWLGTGFYGALIAGIVNYWVYRQLV